MTFLAAKPRGPRRFQPQEHLYQKRSVFAKGWLAGSPSVLKKMRVQNVARWQSGLKKQPRPHFFIDIARELALENTPFQEKGSCPSASPGAVAELIQFYKTGITQFPESLVLRLNFIRTAFHLGGKKDWAMASQVAEETLRAPATGWQSIPGRCLFLGLFQQLF
jgi:hypothetical protein